MPSRWWHSSALRKSALNACSTGPPTGCCGACRATANPRTTRCAMADSEAAAATGSWPIERLRPADAEHLCPLSVEAGWNQVAADWRLMLTLGRGYGVRAANRKWIASALVLPLGPDVCWLSMVLVTQPMRGQGLGTCLLRRSIAEVEASGAAAGLDATELGRPIYLPLGFRDVYPLSRWHVPHGVRHAVSPPDSITVRPATLGDLE